MPKHVDIVKNEWLAGFQLRLASVVRYEASDAFWQSLIGCIDGDYVFATAPHEPRACPFRGGFNTVPLRPEATHIDSSDS